MCLSDMGFSVTVSIPVDSWRHGGPAGETAGSWPQSLRARPGTWPPWSCTPFPKREQRRKACPSCRPGVSPWFRLPPCPPRTAARGPPTSRPGTPSYLVFRTSPVDEKDVARLQLEGSSLGKEGPQKSGSQTPCHQLPFGLHSVGCLPAGLPGNLTRRLHLTLTFPSLSHTRSTGERTHAHIRPDTQGFPTLWLWPIPALSWIAFPCSALPSWSVATWQGQLDDGGPSASPGMDGPPPQPVTAGPRASWTYRVWPSEASCLAIQLLSPLSVARTFICLRTLLRSSSPGRRGFPGRGKARQPQKPGTRPQNAKPSSSALPVCCKREPGLTFGAAPESWDTHGVFSAGPF